MKLLVIDDDEAFVEPLLWRLKREKYEVSYVSSVDDTQVRAGKLKTPLPDCILLDIMMPRGTKYSKQETDAGGLTGLKLLEEIYKNNPKIPVIIITVRRDLDISELQLRFGDTVKKILLKPVTPTEVVETIRTFFPEQTHG